MKTSTLFFIFLFVIFIAGCSKIPDCYEKHEKICYRNVGYAVGEVRTSCSGDYDYYINITTNYFNLTSEPCRTIESSQGYD